MADATFDAIKIGIASPDMIRSWSFGEVKKPETINYRTLKPERDGLYCEKIFGPQKDWECHCGKYKKIKYKGKVCDRCGVEVTKAKVRRERMGHIELAAPCSHIWYFKAIPSRMALVLDISPKLLEQVLYFAEYIVLDPGSTGMSEGEVLNDKQYQEKLELYGNDFRVGMGAAAIKELLEELDLYKLSEELKTELDSASRQKKIHLVKRLEVVESFRKEIHEAIKEASKLGLDGIQMYGTRGDFVPEKFTAERRRGLLQFAKDNGVKFSAICGDFGHGFMSAESNKIYVERSKRVVDLALEMETNIVTTHIGVVPEDKNHPRYKIMQEACYELASYADSINAHFAIETGPETADVLYGFIQDTEGGVGVNLDPANLILYGKANPVDALDVFGEYVLDIHAKDGRYPTNGRALGEETRIGDGKVNFRTFFEKLCELGYDSYVTIEREISETPERDGEIAEEKVFLEKIIANTKDRLS